MTFMGWITGFKRLVASNCLASNDGRPDHHQSFSYRASVLQYVVENEQIPIPNAKKKKKKKKTNLGNYYTLGINKHDKHVIRFPKIKSSVSCILQHLLPYSLKLSDTAASLYFTRNIIRQEDKVSVKDSQHQIKIWAAAHLMEKYERRTWPYGQWTQYERCEGVKMGQGSDLGSRLIKLYSSFGCLMLNWWM